MNYKQLIDSQRYQIDAYLKAHYTITQIAKELGVDKSTISRELKRNSKKRSYNAAYAVLLTKERKQESYKHHVFDETMKQIIDKKLVNYQWSPEQIKGRCDLDNVPMVSIERIYQYIYEDQSNGGLLYTHLRTARRWRKRRLNRRHQRGQIPNRIMIDQRPVEVDTKERFGDWEVDTIIGKNHKTAILTATERKSQFELMVKTDGTKAESIRKQMINLLAPFKKLVRTITSDNGKEFAKHQEIAKKLETEFYFAQPYSPWQRGLNEYNNKLIRQYLPKKTDFNLINNNTINMIISKLNNRPRKLLGYKTPNEVFLSIFNQPVALIN
jgi:IS30 family transposase